MARQAINGQPATPPLYSLLAAADLAPDDGVRWQQGLEWQPERPNGGGAVVVDCFGSTDELESIDRSIINTADPIAVYSEDHCTTLGLEGEDFEGRARRQLAQVTSAFIARELQFGALAGLAGGGDNAALVDGTQIAVGGSTLGEVIPALDGHIAGLLAGQRAMLHVTPQTLDMLLDKGLIYLRGEKWITALGSVVVSDAGYIDESGTVFAYATTMMRIRLSPVELVPGSFDSLAARAEMTDRATNLIRLFAQRLALVEFDHSLASFGDLIVKIATDLVPPTPGS